MRRAVWYSTALIGILGASPLSLGAQVAADTDDRELRFAGCYVIRDSTGRGPGTFAGIFDSVTALDSAFSRKDAEWNPGGSPRRAVRFLADIPDSLAIDTALNVSTWRLVRSDSVEISHSHGFGGVILRFAPSDSRFNGYYLYATDVIDRSRPPTRHRLTAWRVACPASARAP